MIELNASQFFETVRDVRRLATLAGQDLGGADESVDGGVRQKMSETIRDMRDQLALIGAQSAWVAADRFARQLDDASHVLNYGDLHDPLRDIESRFSDHLSFIKLFVVRNEQMLLLGSPAELLGELTATRFPAVWFDCEEAAKCILVQRPTAAVFHSMRMLEIGIRALAKRLGIADPIKPSERNWATILRNIKAKIDSDYPASQRGAGTEGAFFEKLYATLDAVKNPWRNETMHVEGVYQDAEARHILSNAVTLIQVMATDFDNHGNRVNSDSLGFEEPQQPNASS